MSFALNNFCKIIYIYLTPLGEYFRLMQSDKKKMDCKSKLRNSNPSLYAKANFIKEPKEVFHFTICEKNENSAKDFHNPEGLDQKGGRNGEAPCAPNTFINLY